MVGKKEIDFDSLDQAVNNLEAVMQDFVPTHKDFTANLLTEIEDFNSDFMVSLEKVLRAFKDNRALRAVDSIEVYLKDLKATEEAWKIADVAVASRIERGAKV